MVVFLIGVRPVECAVLSHHVNVSRAGAKGTARRVKIKFNRRGQARLAACKARPEEQLSLKQTRDKGLSPHPMT